MRYALVIVMLSATAVALVHIRRAEDRTRHETEQLRLREVRLRRELHDVQLRISELTAPRELRRRVDRTALDLITENTQDPYVAGRPTALDGRH